MKYLIEQEIHRVEDTAMFGGEGDVYLLPEKTGKCVKVFYPRKRSHILERKVLSIINKFSTIKVNEKEVCFGIPELPVYSSESKQFCGYQMPYFSKHQELFRYKYRIEEGSFPFFDSEEPAQMLIRRLFGMIQFLHEIGIIYGDLSPHNVLVEKKTLRPAFIDMDSIQLGTYYSTSLTPEYAHPRVSTEGYGKNRFYVYSTSSDLYALALICFELLVGVNPYFFQTTPVSFTTSNKNSGLSVLHYYTEHPHRLKDKYKLHDNPLREAVFERLTEIEKFHPQVFDLFVQIFIQRRLRLRRFPFEVESLEYDIVKSKPDQLSQFIPISISGDDPPELGMYMNQFELSVL
jgi:serine/threonine protein kinase